MLPLGRIGIRAERGEDRASLLTHDEQLTLMTLWAIFRSPLMFGGDLPSSDAFTLSLLTNAEVLGVNHDSSHGHESYRNAGLIAWTADAPGSKSKYVAVFNTTDAVTAVHLPWNQLGVNTLHASVRDLWEHSELGAKTEVSVSLEPHASVLYKVSPQHQVRQSQ